MNNSFSANQPGPQKFRGFQLPEVVALAVYGMVVGFAIHFHEPWADEAQAWEIAKSLPLPGVFHVLRYEGSPGLWHLLLWCLNKLNVTYAGLHWVSGLIALGASAILVFCAPFPRWIRLALPFTFFLVFQYAVVARSYVLAPLLLFSVAWLWSRKIERPILIALLLGLMANIALHVAMLSGGLAICYAIELWRNRARPLPARRLKLAVALLGVLYICAIVTAWPAHDIAYPQGLSPLLPPQAHLLQDQSKLRHGRSLDALEFRFHERLTGPLASGLILPLPCALLSWAVLAWALFREGKLIYLIPVVLFAVFCRYAAARPWHSGLLFLYVIAVLWIAWPTTQTSLTRSTRHEQVVFASFAVITFVQIWWAAYALNFDRIYPYSPAAATASFLKPYVDRGATIMETGNYFDAEALEPYFDRAIFANKPERYYVWSARNGVGHNYWSKIQTKPDLVLVQWLGDGNTFPSPEAIRLIPEVSELSRLGYRNTRIFCGEMPMQGAAIFETHCELIFESSI